MKETPHRMEFVRNTIKSVDGEVKDGYFTLGKCDIVTIAESPDDEAIAKALFVMGSNRAGETETLTGIPAAKGIEIVKGLP